MAAKAFLVVYCTTNKKQSKNVEHRQFSKNVLLQFVLFCSIEYFPKFITFPCRRSIFNHFLFLVLMPAKAFLVGYGTTSPNYPKVWDIDSFPKMFFRSLYNFVLLNTQNCSSLWVNQFFNRFLFWFWWIQKAFWQDIIQQAKNSQKVWDFSKNVFPQFVKFCSVEYPKFFYTFSCRSFSSHFLFWFWWLKRYFGRILHN